MTEFHTGLAPKGFKEDFESFLFNIRAHRLTQTKKGWKEFHLIDRKKKKILASLAFHIQNEKARSPFRAPFGSFEFSGSLPIKDLIEFYDYVENELKKMNVSEINIIAPPELYSPLQPVVTAILILNGYKVLAAEHSSCILVDEQPLSSKVTYDKRKKLRQISKINLEFYELGIHKLKDAYDLISQSRKNKKQSLSMSFDQLSKTVKIFPQSFFVFGVWLNGNLISACITIKVNPSVVYLFYGAHDSRYNKISPFVFLLVHLYQWCFTHKIRMIDLGTSMLNGKVNASLIDFKIRMGSTITNKFTFQKSLA